MREFSQAPRNLQSLKNKVADDWGVFAFGQGSVQGANVRRAGSRTVLISAGLPARLRGALVTESPCRDRGPFTGAAQLHRISWDFQDGWRRNLCYRFKAQHNMPRRFAGFQHFALINFFSHPLKLSPSPSLLAG